LGEGTATVLDIAVAHGYESYEGFSRAFKAYFGMSPTRYRKIKKGMYEEEGKMLFEDLKGTVAKHTEQIVGALEPIAVETEILAESAEIIGAKYGSAGLTVTILAEAYGELAGRLRQFIKDMKEGPKPFGETVFDLSEKVRLFVMMMDDCTFQTHILMFFTSVEVARTAYPPEKAFTDLTGKMEALLLRIIDSRHTVVRILDALMVLIRKEIQEDAENNITNAAGILQKLAADGKIMVSDAKAAALSMGGYGNAYMCIANDLEKRMTAINEAAEAVKNFSGDPKIAEDVQRRLADAAFHTNINAFNAGVETARSGDRETLKKCTGRIRGYPAQIIEARRACAELLDESAKLQRLAERSGAREEWTTEQKFQKCVEDIGFQSELLAGQTRIEAERCDRDAFRDIAKKAEGALAVFSGALRGDMAGDKEAAGRYGQALAEIHEAYRRECEAAGAHGAAHAFIAKEYGHLAEKIERSLSYV
jgi:hypothetical protein